MSKSTGRSDTVTGHADDHYLTHFAQCLFLLKHTTVLFSMQACFVASWRARLKQVFELRE